MLAQAQAQRGNVLFLILIAVALFAALSYAVTQSSRSGGDASKETNVINTASLTQWPNSVRTSTLRLIVGGIAPEDLYYNMPTEFSGSANSYFVGRESRGVFHPSGGAAPYQKVPANLTRDGNDLAWKFNLDFEVPLLGLSGAAYTGNDLIAFAEGITQSVCDRVNKELHQYESATPVIAAGVTINNNRTALTADPAEPSTQTVLNDGSTPNWFENKAFGCFRNGAAGEFTFYYVLAER